MIEPATPPSIGIVIPTYRRTVLLRRCLARLQKQSFTKWAAVVVHDGENAEFDALAAHYSHDARLKFMNTKVRANDCGNTPRLTGIEYFRRGPTPDYLVFWDDDNYFYRNALSRVVRTADRLGRPDLFLVGMEYRGQVIPPNGLAAIALRPGQVDTACLVARPDLAHHGYTSIVMRNAEPGGIDLLISDFLAFQVMLAAQPHVPSAPETTVGFHDGLRWKPYIRRLLGIPPLGLGSKSWLQKLGLAKHLYRPAGGRD